MGLITYGTWANRPLGFVGKVFAKNVKDNSRTFKNGSYVSVPVGYYHNSLVMPLKYGAIACTLRGSSSLSTADITGVGDLSCSIASGSSLTANGAMGRNLECTIQGTGGLSADIEAKGIMGCTITIGATPSVEDIKQGVLNAIASQYNYSGTIGEKINASGAGGNPWAAPIADNNTTGTFGWFIQKLLSASKFLGLK